jgi:membrane-bound ClpP family serine protease
MQALLAQAAADASSGSLVWGFVLMAAVIVLLFLEMFVPSGGLIGMLAGVAAIESIWAFFKHDTTWGFVALGLYVVLGPIAGVFMFRLWLNSSIGRGMILGGDDPTALDPDAEHPATSERARLEQFAQLRALIGARGTAVTSLRPVGTVKIEGQRLDAMAESGVIDAGTPVVVTDVYDNQIKVRPA